MARNAPFFCQFVFIDGLCFEPRRNSVRIRDIILLGQFMAIASLLALIDDIATVLDDVALMTKVAAQKTAGVLGDDLALNAQQVTGIQAERELPVVWAVAKGSLINKVILVPAALLISVIAPWAIIPLLMIGGAYLCFEGVEKIAHALMHSKEEQKETASLKAAFENPNIDMLEFEQEKIKGAIRTDFVLSAEIVVIALGTVSDANFTTKLLVLVGIGLLMTVGVYGLVAAIVKMDDVGLWCLNDKHPSLMARMKRVIGRGLLLAAPKLMKSLSVIGTLAMFLVGGGILMHGIPMAHAWLHHGEESLMANGVPSLLITIFPFVIDLMAGMIAGSLLLVAWQLLSRLRK